MPAYIHLPNKRTPPGSLAETPKKLIPPHFIETPRLLVGGGIFYQIFWWVVIESGHRIYNENTIDFEDVQKIS